MADPGAELRALLADRDVACPGCGYNLRGLAGEVRPECGRLAALAFVRPWWKFTSIERAFVGGIVWSLIAIAGLVIIIVTHASDPLWVLALWVPGVMLLILAIVVSMWTASFLYIGRKHPRVAVANVVVSWGLGRAYTVVLLLLLSAALGR